MKLMNKNTKAGFTLVELIVVIAILGILAGIAVPTYSGYIQKANQAADEVLLGAANTAFAAACVENDVSARSLAGKAQLSSGTTITTVSCGSDSIAASFEKFFAGNDGTLKYYENASDLVWTGEAFKDLTGILHQAFAGTSFDGKIDDMAALLSGVGKTIGNSFDASKGGKLAAIVTIWNSEGKEEIKSALQSLGFGDFLDTIKTSTNAGVDSVKYVAGDTAGMSSADAIGVIQTMLTAMNDTSGETTEVLPKMEVPTALANALTANGNSAVTNLGLAYAAATGFYQATGTNAPTASDLSGMLTYMETAFANPEFSRYVTEHCEADLNAYVAAMGAINANADDITSLEGEAFSVLLEKYFG